MTRRLIPVAAVTTLLLATACAGATPASQPTTAPAAKPTTPPTSAPAAKPTTAPAAATTAPAAAATGAPAAAAAKPTAATVSLPKPEQPSVKLTHSTIEANGVPYVLARDLGIYQKYGFDSVELLFNEGDAKSFQAIESGQLDFSAEGASVSISSLLTDVPLVTVAFTATEITDDLVASSNVKSAADLKGKTVAVSSFGGTSHASVLLSLNALGLTANDVTIQQIGGQDARVAALKSGAVQAAPIDVALQPDMKAQGFNILVHLPDTPQQFARNGLLVRRDFLEKNPNTVLAFVAASLEGMQAVFTQTDKAIDSYMKFTQQTDRSKAERDIRDFMSYADRDMSWSPDAFTNAREVLVSTNPEIANVDVTKAYSYDILKKLVEMGVYDAVGAPKPKF